MYFLGVPLGYVMRFIYSFVHNYGFSIIVFTLLVKLLLLPLAVKQQKSSAKMAVVQPQMMELQKKYANNQQKLSEELQALYAREGYNPSSGCLTMLIQFPIIMGLYDVIYKPLTHILALSKDVIAPATGIASAIVDMGGRTYSMEPQIIKAVQLDPDAFQVLGSDVVNKIQAMDINFLGINLGDTPSFALNLLLLIPLLSFASSMLMTWLSMKNNDVGDNPMAKSMMASMFMMPFLSAWICFSVPAGVGLYWTVSNLLSIVQMLILRHFYNPQEMAAKAKAESERRLQEEKERRAKERQDQKSGKALSQKELNRQKLAEARRRDAIKYGEEYAEVTDKDIE